MPFKQVDAVTMEEVKTLISADMVAVDSLIRGQLYSDVALIRQVAEYIIHSGGKRLRPMLVILSAHALSYQGNQHHTLAAVIEFIHTATLLHDDVVDESELRRGQQTAHALFGNAASILVGDFLYTRAFQMMVSCNTMRVMEILAAATNIIAEGEVLQLINMGNFASSEAKYLQIVQYKTAKLFEAAMQLGAVLSGADQATETAFAQYGLHLGTAFQIIDDMLDYTGAADKIGKNIGDDLAQGKPTLPLIYTLTHGSVAEQALIRAAVSRADRADIGQILPIIQTSGALEYTYGVASKHSELAKAALADLADGVYKNALLSLADSALRRHH